MKLSGLCVRDSSTKASIGTGSELVLICVWSFTAALNVPAATVIAAARQLTSLNLKMFTLIKQRSSSRRRAMRFVSKSPLPEGDGYNLVVQFKEKSDAKPQNFRFKLDMHTCGECQRAEYACICQH